ncbi:hypothetical protein [Chryseobacterium camelliae]|uniref:Uncharacterized protein n=1 Tax=Chryseobacterium camelliae TaxID=1265445 RepID=A0ABU0TKX4_9FLAO|nr:hypothetical protein [Chryseobacterium camelliae]MDQ1097695.1 hypothetical protein [Chryseobacterium camelliae]
MKKFIAFMMILGSVKGWSQITIGKTDNSAAPSNSSVSLELGNATGGAKGLVLPWVTSAAAVVGTSPTPAPALGTLIFDTSVQKVMYRRIVSGSTVWEDLSRGAQTPVSSSIPDSNAENISAKVIIGGVPASDATRGVLVFSGYQ